MEAAPRALIVGLGLIGGSIGMALRRARWRVAYSDPNVRLNDAVNAGAADRRGDLHDQYDMTILATPVDVAIDLLPKLRGLTTSVCSVMRPLRLVAGASRFVAGHPLAGSAESGLRAASGDLFRGKKWFVDGDDADIARLISNCGAERELVDPATHDAAVALTSHIPQILSTALAAYLDGRDVTRFAGSGLATFLRLAASDASVWTPIVAANRDAIREQLPGIMRVLEQILAGEAQPFLAAQNFVKKL